MRSYVVRVAIGALDVYGDVIVQAENPEDAKGEAEELVRSGTVEAIAVTEAED